MRDNNGNRIEKDCLLHWHLPASILSEMTFKVLEVSDGGLSTGVGREVTPPRLILAVDLPIPAEKLRPGEEPQMVGMWVLPNPAVAAAIEDMMQRKKN